MTNQVTVTEQAWADRAACRTHPTSTFYAAGTGHSDETMRDAVQICAGCPVREECLQWSIAAGEIYDGIWGGATPRQRRALARQAGLRTFHPVRDRDATHGTAKRYWAGCHCDPCRAGNAAYERRRNAPRVAAGDRGPRGPYPRIPA